MNLFELWSCKPRAVANESGLEHSDALVCLQNFKYLHQIIIVDDDDEEKFTDY